MSLLTLPAQEPLWAVVVLPGHVPSFLVLVGSMHTYSALHITPWMLKMFGLFFFFFSSHNYLFTRGRVERGESLI